MDDIYKNIEECNLNKKNKNIVCIWWFNCWYAKKLNPIVTELFITWRKLNIFRISTTQNYFPMLNNIRFNSTHYFIMKIPNKQIATTNYI